MNYRLQEGWLGERGSRSQPFEPLPMERIAGDG
jgi:hypothetical protein